MSVNDHKTVVWRAYDITFNQRNPAGARDCYAPDYRCHSSIHPGPIGFDELEAGGQEIVDAFPDVTVSFEDVFGEGDRLVVRHLFHGTHLAEFKGIPATGKQVTFSGTDIYRLADGRIAEEWAQPDVFAMLRQLGVVPAIAGPQ